VSATTGYAVTSARVRRIESLDASETDIAVLDLDPGGPHHAATLDLRSAINRLEERLRLAIALGYFANLDSTEIGAALGAPPARVRTRLRRGLARVEDALAPDPHRPAMRTYRSESDE
jgi:DNA-directed RNA polymerase specialized sigma24 family protein